MIKPNGNHLPPHYPLFTEAEPEPTRRGPCTVYDLDTVKRDWIVNERLSHNGEGRKDSNTSD